MTLFAPNNGSGCPLCFHPKLSLGVTGIDMLLIKIA